MQDIGHESDPRITGAQVSVFEVPTSAPESDGTLSWASTTLVLVELDAGGRRGLGYTYADAATGVLARALIERHVLGARAFDLARVWLSLTHAVRNMGLAGHSSMAISAIDCALWDLKARILDLPLTKLLGQVRPSIAAYGSGGFTSYPVGQLQAQLVGWKEQGLSAVKMKVGSCPREDAGRVAAAREALGEEVELYVDANGAYTRRESLRQAADFLASNVTWFEEPVIAADFAGLRWLRGHLPPAMHVVSGEYGYSLDYFRGLLHRGCVDIMQADVTRCGGVTGFLQVAALCAADRVPLSSHCAPAQHVALGCALPSMQTVEWFADHQRIEQLFFDGAQSPIRGHLSPDLDAPGFGLTFKRLDAARYQTAAAA